LGLALRGKEVGRLGERRLLRQISVFSCAMQNDSGIPAYAEKESPASKGKYRMGEPIYWTQCYCMKDEVAKSKGLPFSTSRSQEKAYKKNTKKARRQLDRRRCREDME